MAEWEFLNAREQAELKLAKVYVEHFDHGTSGHLAYTVIAKLADEIVRLKNQITSAANTQETYMD